MVVREKTTIFRKINYNLLFLKNKKMEYYYEKNAFIIFTPFSLSDFLRW